MPDPKVQTYKDLKKWLNTLSQEQVNAPILATGGADDFGGTEYVVVAELVDVASEHVQVSGGYQGPVLLVQEFAGDPSKAEAKEVGSYAEWLREQQEGLK